MYSRVYVEITNICNMACSFCHGHSRRPERMSKELFQQVLSQLKGITGYVYYHLMGEPLTHPLLPEFLHMAQAEGFRSVITTNGTLLKKHKQALLSAPVHKVNISLHSFEKQIGSQLDSYLEEVCDFARDAAQAGILVSMRLWNRGFDEGRNDATLETLQALLPGEWTENTRGYRIRDRLFLEWGERFAWPDKNAPIQSEAVYCHGLMDHCGILCDGTVVPCCLDSDGVIALGNLRTQPLAQILSSPRATAMAAGFRNRKPTEDLCRRCGYACRF